MLPSILGPIFCGEEKTPWELHQIVKSWVEPKDKEVKRLIRPILERLIWSCVKVRNEDTSASEIYMTVENLPSQKLKYWQKLQLEGTVGNWPEAQRAETPQKNIESVVAAAA